MKLVRLTADYPLLSFDCGDEDLNEFLLDDAIGDYWKSVEENQKKEGSRPSLYLIVLQSVLNLHGIARLSHTAIPDSRLLLKRAIPSIR